MSETRKLLQNLIEAIGRYGVQCSETKELAPEADLTDAIAAFDAHLNTVDWISPDDPPDSDEIVCILYGNKKRTIARYSGGDWRFLLSGFSLAKTERITGWQPLPDLPEKTK